MEAAKESTTLSSRHSSQLHLDMSELDAQLNSKDEEILHLFESNQKLQAELAALREEFAKERDLLRGELKQKDARVEEMEKKLASQKDYEEVKRELM